MIMMLSFDVTFVEAKNGGVSGDISDPAHCRLTSQPYLCSNRHSLSSRYYLNRKN